MVAFLLLAMSAAALPPCTEQTPSAQATESESVWPQKEGRLFALPSKQAWGLVQRRLKELGLSVANADRKNQLLVTKWRGFGTDTTQWLPVPALGEQYVAKRVVFQIFVSPFVEPAHIYVGSVTEFQKKGQAAPSTVYNDPSMGKALMRELAPALAQDSFPIPSTYQERQQLSRSVLKEQFSDCVPEASCSKAPAGEPTRIAASPFGSVLIPTPETVKTVHLDVQIREDGAATGVRLVGPSVNRRLEAAEMGPVSLYVYSPLRVCGCPAETVIRLELPEEPIVVVVPGR